MHTSVWLLRSLGLLVGMALAVVGCNDAPQAGDRAAAGDTVIVHAAAEPAPVAVVAGAPATAKLIAWTDPPATGPSPAKSWQWHVDGVEYSADGKSFGNAARGRTASAELADAGDPTTQLKFHGAAGYWRVSYHAAVTCTDDAGKVSRGTSPDKAVTFVVVEARITVWDDLLNNGAGDWGPSAEVAAGAIESRVHQTDVFVTVAPAVAADVPLTLHGGTGQSADAALRIGGKTIGPDQTLAVRTDAGGHVIGLLTSSDVRASTPVTITGGGGSAAVTFGWDNYTASDKWYQSPDYMRAGDSSTLEVKFALNGRPLDGHKILLVVGKVEYTDKDGKRRTLLNTPEHPQDLADWASFDEPDDPTDGTGKIYSKVYYKDKCSSATNVVLSAYDLTVLEP